MKLFSVLIFVLCVFTNKIVAQDLTITFTNITNSKGIMRLGFYKNDESFRKGEPLFEKSVSKSSMKDGVLSISYNDIEPGEYGIAVLDDENGNNKIDYSLLFPKEGFGFSNYLSNGFCIPVYEDFKFTFEQANNLVIIKMRYL